MQKEIKSHLWLSDGLESIQGKSLNIQTCISDSHQQIKDQEADDKDFIWSLILIWEPCESSWPSLEKIIYLHVNKQTYDHEFLQSPKIIIELKALT